MNSDGEIDRALAAVNAALNDRGLDEFKPAEAQELVNESLGDSGPLTVDAGGGLHDDSGKRIGAIRRTPSGEWIIDRQNPAAERSDAAIPRYYSSSS
jgi:hypothetical protein